MTTIRFFVSGEPKPQPRPRAWARKFGAAVRAGVYDNGGADGWKAAIIAQANEHRPAAPLTGPLEIAVSFYMPRPKGHYGSGRNAGKLRASAPLAHTQKPDCDNLIKAVLDAMTVGGWWGDDAQIISMRTDKQWAQDGRPGCLILIRHPASAPSRTPAGRPRRCR